MEQSTVSRLRRGEPRQKYWGELPPKHQEYSSLPRGQVRRNQQGARLRGLAHGVPLDDMFDLLSESQLGLCVRKRAVVLSAFSHALVIAVLTLFQTGSTPNISSKFVAVVQAAGPAFHYGLAGCQLTGQIEDNHALNDASLHSEIHSDRAFVVFVLSA